MGLAGCAHYKAKPLKMLTQRTQTAEQSISFTHRIFNAYDCKKYLDRNTLAQGYQPIQITLTNNTDRNLSISTKNFSLDCINPQSVATSVHTNTAARAVGYGVTGLFIWPFIIPAIVDGIGSHKANEQLDIDFAHKALRVETIKPHTTINGLIFISTDEWNDDFALHVTDEATNEIFALSTTKPVVKV